MRRLRTVSLALTALSLAGCASQVAALAPVSGDNAYAVRTATIDVLLDKGYSLTIAPACVQGVEAITCDGTVLDGSAVSVNAPGKGKESMTVSVGGKVVFEGSIQQVLDQAAGIE